jgi:enoyl-CoA hydratase/3-hydroxyacyl-CoA dehydrogenase
MIVGVIGSGSIGPDLAYGFMSALSRRAAAGSPEVRVYLHDIRQEALDAGVARIRGYIQKGVARGKLSARAAQAMEALLVPTLAITDLAPCAYVLEAASEELAIKRAILASLEDVVAPDCLIGFATSGLPRAQIAAAARRPARCFVNHPFYPAWRSLPVEVVLSGDEALGQRMLDTLRLLGKVPVITADVPCFAADDIFCNYVSEAARIVAEGLASAAQVDRAVDDAIGGGGPLNVMDLTRGNLLTVHCQELMRAAPGASAWFEPPALLRTQGNRPWHDRKNPGDPRCDAALAQAIVDRILAVLLGRSLWVVEQGICEPADLNWLTRMALGFRKGVLELAAELGAERVRALCTAHAAAHPGFPVPRCIEQGQLPAFLRDLRVERSGEVAIVRVVRPEVRNALSRRTVAELGQVFAELERDASVRGVVFTSHDGALAGADVSELAALRGAAEARDICLQAHPVLQRISSLSKPVVAALDGPVLGGGAEFAMACHARVVGPELQVGQPEVNLGIIPGYGGTQRLPRLIGLGPALELLRTGRSIGAGDACRLGWASGEPVADVVAAAVALVRSHLAGAVRLAPVDPAPVAVPVELPGRELDIGHRSRHIDTILVDVVRQGLARPLAEGLVIEAEGFARCKASVDCDIGLKNFLHNGPRTPAVFLHE